MKRTIGLLRIHWLLLALFVGALSVSASRVHWNPKQGAKKPVISIELSDGRPPSEQTEAQAPEARAENLPVAETEALLKRLPPIETKPAEKDFNRRVESMPAPRPGKVVPPAFDALNQTAPEATVQEPGVIHHGPVGPVKTAPKVTITFATAMVPLNDLETRQANLPPVQLSPMVAGSWRWVSPKTLVFQNKTAMPGATRYAVTIPAGIKDAAGNPLAEPIEFAFETPTAQPRAFYPDPHTGQSQQPLLALAFNQKVKAADVLEVVTLSFDKSRYPLTLAPEAVWKNDERLRSFLAAYDKDAVVVFRPQQRLPSARRFKVQVGPEIPSAEGPEREKGLHTYNFQTYDVLKVVGHSGEKNRRVFPGGNYRVSFNNPILVDAVKESWYTVSPQPKKLTVFGSHRQLVFEGAFEPGQTYKVTLKPPVSDTFGQTLAEAQTLSFRVADRGTHFSWNADAFYIPDPYAQPGLRVASTNVKNFRLQVHAVAPRKDWLPYTRVRRKHHRFSEKQPALQGKTIVDERITVKGALNEQVVTNFDLTRWLGGKSVGHLLIRLTPGEAMGDAEQQRSNRFYPLESWVQVTQLGMDVLGAANQGLAWVNHLKDGTAVEGAQVTSLSLGNANQKAYGQTNAAGVLPLPPLNEGPAPEALLAELGDDSAILTPGANVYSGNWGTGESHKRLLWHVFDDRGMYKPGETVHFKGWTRLYDRGRLETPTEGTDITYILRESRGNELQNGRLTLNAAGGFDLKVDLPDGMNLGHTTLELIPDPESAWMKRHQLRTHARTTRHHFQVQEFRRPEYEVTLTVPDQVVFAGDRVGARAAARYYAGGPLGGANIQWNLSAGETSYTPPNWSRFTFGNQRLWWLGPIDSSENQAAFNFSARTDSMGFHDLDIKLGEASNELPVNVSVNSTVIDVNRQRWSSSGRFLVHAGSAYVGLRTNRYFMDKGTPYGVEVVVTDINGKALPGREIVIEVAHLEWKRRQGTYSLVPGALQTFELTSGDQPVSFAFQTPEGGQYRITARTSDEEGRTNRTQMTRWVSGAAGVPVDRVEQESITLIPDKEEYAVGDTAEILVQAPFSPAEGTLTVHADGILETRRFSMKDGGYTLKVAITEAMVPNVFAQVDLVGKAHRFDSSGLPNPQLAPRPAYATGQLNLKVPPVSRSLLVVPTPDKTKLSPGEETGMSVTVRDNSGKPVKDAEVALFVVDEAVLALSAYTLGNPLDTFYPQLPDGLTSFHNRRWVVLADADEMMDAEGDQAMLTTAFSPQKRMMAPMAAAPMMEESMLAGDAVAGGGGGGPAPIVVRTNFNPLAAFFAEQQTDADGNTRVSFKLPDNLTRYRVMAVAVGGGNFYGIGEATMTARLPLMVRPSAPRFLNYGDQFELPVVLQNQTDEAMSVDLAVEAHNAVLTAGAGRRFEVPANNRVEVRLAAQTRQAGEAFFRIAVQSGDLTDAALVKIPVWTPATSEAFAVYGEIDEPMNLGQALTVPRDAFPEFGGVKVSTTATAMHMLEDAVMYLYTYPYECAEQRASRVMSLLAAKDMMAAFDNSIDESEIHEQVLDDLNHLRGIQNGDGGFGFWYRNEKSIPFVSVHVAHAVARALRADIPVAPSLQQGLVRYLKNLHIAKHLENEYSERVLFTLRAYALFVRDLMGEKVGGEAGGLLKTVALEDASLEGLGWLLHCVPTHSGHAKTIVRHFDNRAEISAGTATFTEHYGKDAGHLILHSSRRSDGVVLESLIAAKPDHPLIAKVVAGLNAHRTKGAWGNTQENLFVLFALKRYFETFEGVTPDMVARVWLNGAYQGEHAFVGRTTDRGDIEMAMADIAKGGDSGQMILQKEGKGRLYYRLGLRYAPKNLKPKPVDRGFYVSRSYEGVDDPEDVQRQKDGSWLIRRGAKVRVTLQMVAPSARYHVALVDPMPAGFEAVNPALKGSEPIANQNVGKRAGAWSWWYRTWFQHQNLRDERVEAFTQYLWAGVHEYRYIARATTPGEFVAPPPKAEEMYSPETFGRGAGEIVVVR